MATSGGFWVAIGGSGEPATRLAQAATVQDLGKSIFEFKQWCKEYRNKRLKWIMAQVKSKLRGLKNYFDVIGNSESLREKYYIYSKEFYTNG